MKINTSFPGQPEQKGIPAPKHIEDHFRAKKGPLPFIEIVVVELTKEYKPKEKRMKKVLHPQGTPVRFEYSWYGKDHAHHGHECLVVKSEIVRKGKRNYYKYELWDKTTGTTFKAEDTPPTSKVIPI